MIEQIIKVVISYIVPALIGFLVARVVNYKKKNDGLKNAIMTMIQCNISNTYFLYDPIKQIPDYLYVNTLNQYKAYKDLGGNAYIEHIMSKMENWEITKTDILK